MMASEKRGAAIIEENVDIASKRIQELVAKISIEKRVIEYDYVKSLLKSI